MTDGQARMFVALYPSAEAQAHLQSTLAEVREAIPAEHTSTIRWIPPERWHITLAFLAHVDLSRVDQLKAALDEVAAAQAPLDRLQLSGSGAFGSTLWLGAAATGRGTAAERLAKATQRAARSCGIEVERRPWRAHLSIARVRAHDRAVPRAATSTVVDALADYAGPPWTCDHFTLVDSILGPQPQHIPAGTFALRGETNS